jgi:hypothetical protein
MAKLKRLFLFVSGIQGHRDLARAVRSRGVREEEGGEGEARPWRRYLDASETVVEKWGGPWMRKRLLGRQRGVWIMAALLALVTAGCAVVVYSSLLGGLGGMFDQAPGQR